MCYTVCLGKDLGMATSNAVADAVADLSTDGTGLQAQIKTSFGVELYKTSREALSARDAHRL